jgi:subtilisin family serine protease
MFSNKSNKKSLLLFTIFTVYLLIVPIIGIIFAGDLSRTYNKGQLSELDNFLLKSTKQKKNTQASISYRLDYDIFDMELNSLLSDLQDSNEIDAYIDIIAMFKERVTQSERKDILNSIFTEYSIKKNYQLISGVYLSLSAKELISNIDKLESSAQIERFYKSRSFKSSILDENSLKQAALNINNYDNWWIQSIGAENLPFNGSGVRVAVIDTGMYNHTDLNIVENRGFVTGESENVYYDDYGHGTHVGGIIGGSGKASSGKYRGVAPGVGLINARAGDLSGLLDADIISAIEWCANPAEGDADIISMSFGGGNPEAFDPITKAISNAVDNYGVIFVSSSGNSGQDYFSGASPAAGIDVISVGATNENDELASFSSVGPAYTHLDYIDVVAPGVNVISAEARDSILSKLNRFFGEVIDVAGSSDYIPLSGTSMSCPMVSGALAVLLEAYPDLTPETARIALREGARKLSIAEDSEYIKSGEGLINVSASLTYLDQLEQTYTNVNDAAKVSTDVLPVEPYDLLNFPGDVQLFNLTLISGKSNTYDIEIPADINGITISSDKTSISYSNSGVNFFALEVSIDEDASPGLREFQVNISSGGRIYDIIEFEIDVKFQEGKILMESYHGLNDWLEREITYNQMRFYNAMKTFTEQNISIDYSMEFWTPYYSKDLDNSLLTKQKLAQYDLIVLQNPMLPYSPLEISNLKEYFNNGGNILFLGTRHQELNFENINVLFSELQTGIQIKPQNIFDASFVGLGAITNALDAIPENNHEIFAGVEKFYWDYGTTFQTTGNAISIAEIDNSTVSAVYDGSSLDKGKLVTFGDLQWMGNAFNSQEFSLYHENLIKNLADFLVKEDDISLSVDLTSFDTTNSQINISVYAKDSMNNRLIESSTLNSNLSISIQSGGSKDTIIMNSVKDGIAINDTYNLPFGTDSEPYFIQVNLTYGMRLIQETSKIFYFNPTDIPQINSLSMSPANQTRGDPGFTITASLDDSGYADFNAYLSIFANSFYNINQTINSTIQLSHSGPPLSTTYQNNFDPTENDPSGYILTYILPYDGSYANFSSPRVFGKVLNNDPSILEDSSSFSVGDQTILFSDTKVDDSSRVYSVSQGSVIDFSIDTLDSFYEDNQAEMSVYINFFMVGLSDPKFSSDNSSYIIPFPSTNYIVEEMTFQDLSDKHTGSFTIPRSVLYSTIEGNRYISTAADLRQQDDYAAILWINVWDSEGGTDDFIIIFSVSASFTFDPMTLIIIVAIVGGIVGAGLLIYIIKRSKNSNMEESRDYSSVRSSYESSYSGTESESFQSDSFFCPFCGYDIGTPKKFCPNCGKSLEFD